MSTTEQPPYVTEALQRAIKELAPGVDRLSLAQTYAMVWLCLGKLAEDRGTESIAEWMKEQADLLEDTVRAVRTVNPDDPKPYLRVVQ